ncbi:MAG: thioredoxin-disulfide reductase [Clostridiales bacterium GWC2_40_7]|nr:MAG: thioredoxin-disulfide reductase [Clostridiales bacterium GWC2_40_7]
MYDVIIIGRGPAGLSASLYTARANLKTLIIGKYDSRLLKADRVDNYFGFSSSISGEQLLSAGEQQAQRFGVEIVEDEVIALEKEDFYRVTASKGQYTAKALLLATGQPQKKVKIENLSEFEGKGVSYCATCDGFFYNNLKVGVLGFKDYAMHEASDLLANTSNIVIYTNGKELDISEAFRETARQFSVNTKPIAKIDGGEFLQRIHFNDGTSEELDGLFVAYESPSTLDFARTMGILADGSTVVVDRKQQTNLEGVFAAGDCAAELKQVSVAVGQGAIAGKAIVEYVRSL